MNHSLRWISAQKTSYPVDSTNLFSMLFTIKKKSCLLPKPALGGLAGQVASPYLVAST